MDTPSSPPAAAGPYSNTNLNKRGPVACKRCRRAKTKCLHAGNPPCRSCAESGLAAECTFPPKGTSFIDRAPTKRVKRSQDGTPVVPVSSQSTPTASPQITSSSSGGAQTSPPPHGSPSDLHSPALTTPLSSAGSLLLSPTSPSENPEDLLPPQELLEAACEVFFVRVNQCAFLHRPTFLARLRDPRRQSSPLLLLALCALATRFLPALAQFRGGSARSAAYFGDAARARLFARVGAGEASVEACQAAYLLGLADWGACKGRRGWMILGIAIRMSFLLGLHREETHRLPEHATPADIIAAEEAKRTFWTLYINDCSVSNGVSRPPSIRPNEITAPLPADEDSFAFGTLAPAFYLDRPAPAPTAGLSPTAPRAPTGYPGEAPGANVSMHAQMVLAADLWGRAARWACTTRFCAGAPPTDPAGEYARLKDALFRWSAGASPRLQYSRTNLAVYFQRNLESSLVYNHVTHRAAEIMLRRPFLPLIIRSVAPASAGPGLSLQSVRTPWSPPPPREFWVQCGREMFMAAFEIVAIIGEYAALKQAHYASLSPHLGFNTFLASATLTYIWRWPWLFPERALDAPRLVLQATEILSSLIPHWPMARQWVRILRRPVSAHIDEAVRADVGADQREGIFRESALSSGESESSNGDADADVGVDAELDGQGGGDGHGGDTEGERRGKEEEEEGMDGAGGAQTPRWGLGGGGGTADAASLHTLARCAAESISVSPTARGPGPGALLGPGAPAPFSEGLPVHLQQQQQRLQHAATHLPHHHHQPPPQQVQIYGPVPEAPYGLPLPGAYLEMPFGDPSNPQSFNDVLAFMEGAEQWHWPTQ